jgi:hypothetical protein
MLFTDSIRNFAGIVVFSAFLFLTVDAQVSRPEGHARWYKGNTHTHTLNSDGDSAPESVAKWYRDSGYDFVFITDHEFITPIDPLNALFDPPTSFNVFSGQEVTDSFDRKPYHINGLGLGSVVSPSRLDGAVKTLQKNIDGVRNAGGVPQLNHPNFGWALSADDIGQLKNVKLMEIFNGHPTVNNLGGGGVPSVEEIWDQVLSAGMLIYGVATDDAHHFKRIGVRSAAVPGRGWVVVRSAELSQKAILEALDRGDFYASTGIELEEYAVTKDSISIKIKEDPWSKYRVLFIGQGGRVLGEVTSNPAVYRFRGDERYVRAKVIESNGKLAWAQPVFVLSK